MVEARWGAAAQIFKTSKLTIVGAEFTDGSREKVESIVETYLDSVPSD